MAIEVQTGRPDKKGRGKPEMNVTPLVDVVLVLLIIFMVLTPLLNELFWIHVPNKPKDQTEEEEKAEEGAEEEPPLVVTVNRRGRIQINRDVYTDGEFPERLRRMLVARGERSVYFDAHDDVPFERAARVLDLARGGGAAHIAVVTEKIQ
jgi:biopolymer transport protein TolR